LYKWDLGGVMAHIHKALFLGVLLLNEYNLCVFCWIYASMLNIE
jgi:hypothetical protein